MDEKPQWNVMTDNYIVNVFAVSSAASLCFFEFFSRHFLRKSDTKKKNLCYDKRQQPHDMHKDMFVVSLFGKKA